MPPSLDTSRSAWAAGDRAGATAMLERVAAGGGAGALVDEALQHFDRTNPAAQPAFARAALRAAAAVGHGGAGLTEAALAANGVADQPDWPAAVAMLRATARHDALAAQHLELLGQMRLTATGDPAEPPRGEILSRDPPRVLLAHNFCTPLECAHIVSIVMDTMAPARIFHPADQRLVEHPTRTSHESAIGPLRESLVVHAINRRIAAISGTRVGQGEPLTVLRYEPGQQYRLHNDAIPGEANQRIRTVLIYLSDGYHGGETEFPDLGIRVRGRQGDALVFDNVGADARPLARARHAGLPVTAGAKWLATRWIRAAPLSLWPGA